MNPEQPGRPDGDMTIRRRWRSPAQPPRRQAAPPQPPPPGTANPLFPPPRSATPYPPPPGNPASYPPPHRNATPPPRAYPLPPQEDNRTRRMEYTPDLLPDVAYQTGKSRSGYWWLFAVGGILLLVAALAVAVLLSVNS